MPDSMQINQVLHFAGLLAARGSDGATEVARERGWIDPAGRITDTGRQLHRALSDQRETRSIYRSLY
jgi:hypothetical protein